MLRGIGLPQRLIYEVVPLVLVLRRRQEIVLCCATGRPLAYAVKEGMFFEVLAAIQRHFHLDLKDATLAQCCQDAFFRRPGNKARSLHNLFSALDLAIEHYFAELALDRFVGLQPRVLENFSETGPVFAGEVAEDVQVGIGPR